MVFAPLRSCFTSWRSLWLAFAVMLPGLAGAGAVSAQVADGRISASYDVYFNGMSLGRLNFTSTVSGGTYQLDTDTDLKLPLLGSIFEAATWRGSSQSRGSVVGSEPQPTSYHFDFKGGGKRGAVDMAFAGDRVRNVTRLPEKVQGPEYVQVKPEHLRNVVDPMSAVMLFSRNGSSHRTACQRSLPIYDGEQRFDLALSYKRAVRVKRDESGGYEGPVIICRVRYQPVAGYKPHKEDVKAMAKNRDIELWLMPLPGTRNYAPYRIVLPLPVGTAGAELARFNIESGNGRRIALVRQ